MAEKIKERKREENWSSAEKDCLRKLIYCHIQIIENKGNDTRTIIKKKAAWAGIKKDMLAAGFDRDIKRMKQQWMRMKIGARKALSKKRKTSVATEDLVITPTLDDYNIQMEDTCLIDNNPIPSAPVSPTPSFPGYIPNIRYSPHNSTSPTNAAEDDVCNDTLNATPTPNRLMTRLQNRSPNVSTKADVSRQEQILSEANQSKELHLLKMKQLRAEIAHQARMHKRQEEQLEEIHALKCQLLREHIEQQKSHALIANEYLVPDHYEHDMTNNTNGQFISTTPTRSLTPTQPSNFVAIKQEPLVHGNKKISSHNNTNGNINSNASSLSSSPTPADGSSQEEQTNPTTSQT